MFPVVFPLMMSGASSGIGSSREARPVLVFVITAMMLIAIAGAVGLVAHMFACRYGFWWSAIILAATVWATCSGWLFTWMADQSLQCEGLARIASVVGAVLGMTMGVAGLVAPLAVLFA